MEITPGIIIFANYQNPWVPAANSSNEIMQVLEILIVMTQQNAILACSVSEMNGIIFTREAHVCWPLNVVTRPTKQAS